MSASNAFEILLARHIFLGEAIAALNLPAATSAATLTLHLHTGDPGEAGTAATNVAVYSGYQGQARAVGSANWTESGGVVHPASDANFPTMPQGSPDITHFSVCAGSLIIVSGPYSCKATDQAVIPQLSTGLAITFD